MVESFDRRTVGPLNRLIVELFDRETVEIVNSGERFPGGTSLRGTPAPNQKAMASIMRSAAIPSSVNVAP